MPGPVPKPASKRRRRNVPVSYGAAQPTTAPAAASRTATLGIDDPHPLIARCGTPCRPRASPAFYSEADWERLRFELWYANRAMRSPRPISGHTWAAIQHGLTELLVVAGCEASGCD